MLDYCPRCEYPLRDLPAEHDCPECGLGYDRDSRIWHRRRPKTFLLVMFFVAVGYYLPAQYLFEPMGLGRTTRLLLALLSAALVTACLVWLMRLYQRGLIAAIVRDGLFFRIRSLRSKLIPWARIADARKHPGKRAVLVHLKGGIRYIEISNVFADRSDAESFAALVRSRVSV